MVRKGNLEVEIVEATTKQPFKEHPGKNGYDSYIEVEPDIEYFINLRSFYSQYIIVCFAVDGKDLGYQSSFGPSLGHDESFHVRGVWTCENNLDKQTALKVDKMIFVPGSSSSSNDTKVGEITIKVYEKIKLEGYYHQRDNHTSSWSGHPNRGQAGEEGKKVVKSTIGKSTETTSRQGGRIQNSRKGQLLSTIKLKYCSTVGLIAAGVLPKPNQWEWYKMVKPSAINHQKMEIQPTIMDQSVRNVDGTVLQEGKVEMFDLTKDDE